MLAERKLGQTGLTVTQLGYGSMGLRGPKTWGVRVVEEEAADRFLNLILDAGINFIDTSPDYGSARNASAAIYLIVGMNLFWRLNVVVFTRNTRIIWRSIIIGIAK